MHTLTGLWAALGRKVPLAASLERTLEKRWKAQHCSIQRRRNQRCFCRALYRHAWETRRQAM